jgi:hypothetical protein
MMVEGQLAPYQPPAQQQQQQGSNTPLGNGGAPAADLQLAEGGHGTTGQGGNSASKEGQQKHKPGEGKRRKRRGRQAGGVREAQVGAGAVGGASTPPRAVPQRLGDTPGTSTATSAPLTRVVGTLLPTAPARPGAAGGQGLLKPRKRAEGEVAPLWIYDSLQPAETVLEPAQEAGDGGEQADGSSDGAAKSEEAAPPAKPSLLLWGSTPPPGSDAARSTNAAGGSGSGGSMPAVVKPALNRPPPRPIQ